MEQNSALAALADPARWRIVTALADRPQSVGVIADEVGLRQPQATKHLQTLERAGLVVSQRSGQRKIFALEAGPLRDLAVRLGRLADGADRQSTVRADFDNYGASLAEELASATAHRWADGRSFSFRRRLAAPRETVWAAVTEADRMARWWVPDHLRVARLIFEAVPGGRVIQEYADAADRTGVDGLVGRAEGVVRSVVDGERIGFRLSPLLPTGAVAFTADYTVTLADHRDAPGGASAGDPSRPEPVTTELDVRFRIDDSVVESADFIAGIELGWNQSLDRLAALINAEQK
ncbi:metalloregulator ArsR/SmtB family transcription factor [Microlunatus soli]|uniref:Uncharacterized conserved protein YndB, AHSA1/START domain n=1 Tax=Microlunatus soli TaxID=630515 RepID=A0A1H1PAR0_9ACTN|nr:metalloregulator ArsR/SmtB family transcription factor [Microlunatus soli]SDS07709.1 Uncharacterized conserved protein YndB, AHSA1/START domain [Microlunatus soli]